MRLCLVFVFLLGATFAPCVKGKSHGRRQGMQKTSHSAKEKDVVTVEDNLPQVFPTLVTFEASSREKEDEEVSSGHNTNAKKWDKEVTEEHEKGPAVLLSEEELADLLEKEEDEEAEAEAREDEDDGLKLAVTEGQVTLKDDKKPDDSLETEKKKTHKEEKRDDAEEEGSKVEEKVERPVTKLSEWDRPVGLLGETEGSTESELPADLDYAADSGILIPVQVDLNTSAENQESPSEKDLQDQKKEEVGQKELFMQDMQSPEAGDGEEVAESNKDPTAKSNKGQPSEKEPEATVDGQELKSSGVLKSGSRRPEKEEEMGKNESGAFTKRKTRKQKKNKRARKHSPQRNETHPAQDQSQLDRQESEGSSTENVVHKAKRKRTGKWGPLVGVNPVQIRAGVDLYPRSRSSFSGEIHLSETPPDPCDNFRCKRGKTCKLDADGKPGCVCQEPLECPPSMNTFEQVCGTDNKTYDTTCELFATKCKLEGTKRGNKLHLDYTGPCKLIPPCVKNELVQFPLRMRDWLKNVLLQLYEHDSTSPGFLTPKQRFRVKKISENERRLQAGNHSVELLALDFEKNYNMYIYPVHWQFAQLDQHPSDRVLSHSELAPLRVPLVPMEHCTSLFFRECDADKDKQVTLKEWTSCFGIKDEDMDVNLLF